MMAIVSERAPTSVRDLRPEDLPWAESFLEEHLSGRLHARRGQLIDVLSFPGLVAISGSERIGLLTFNAAEEDCELVSIATAEAKRGIGTALVDALRSRAGTEHVWVVTTNDNLDALRFYQRKGFALRALRPGAVDEARRTLKPWIPKVGAYGIPIRDELELEMGGSGDGE